jgi:hypothetical protein
MEKWGFIFILGWKILVIRKIKLYRGITLNITAEKQNNYISSLRFIAKYASFIFSGKFRHDLFCKMSIVLSLTLANDLLF